MIRVAWNRQGVQALAAESDVLIIVDVLSFTTSVSIAVARGAVVLPYRWRDASVQDFARQHDAELALGRGQGTRWSLSPSSLLEIPAGLRIVLRSFEWVDDYDGGGGAGRSPGRLSTQCDGDSAGGKTLGRANWRRRLRRALAGK